MLFLAPRVAVVALSSGLSGPTKSKILQSPVLSATADEDNIYIYIYIYTYMHTYIDNDIILLL